MTLANFLRNLHFAIGFICASAAWAQNITVVNGASYSDTIAPDRFLSSLVPTSLVTRS